MRRKRENEYEVVSEMKVRLHVVEPKSYTEKNVLGELYSFCDPQIVSNAKATKMRVRDKERSHFNVVFDLTCFDTDENNTVSSELIIYLTRNYRKLTSEQIHQMFDCLYCGSIIDGEIKRLKFFVTKGEM